MPTQKKVKAVEDLVEKLSRVTVAVSTDFSGMSVNAMTALRRHLRDQGVEYRVVKNTLAERAAEATEHPEFKELLQGPTALAFGYDDPIAPIKALVDYVRANRLPVVLRAAAIDGRVYRDAQLTALATLPTKEVLVGRLVGQLSSPITRLVSALNRPLQGLVTVLNGPLQGLTNVLNQRIAQQSNS